jgi:integrase
LLGLRWGDLDLAAGHLTVRRTLARTPGGATFQDVKTHRSARRITIPGECVTSLRWYQRRQQIDRREAGSAWRDLGLVVTRSTGGPLDAAHVHRTHHLICDLADIRRVRFHDLRHSAATLLQMSDVALGASFGRFWDRCAVTDWVFAVWPASAPRPSLHAWV